MGNNPLLFIDPWGLCTHPVEDMWKGATYSVGQAARDIVDLAVHGDPFVKTALGVAAVTTAGPIAVVGAIEAGPVITAGALANPATIQNGADFVQGALQPGPPPSSLGGYAGATTRYFYDKIFSTP